ncbi:MAG: ABC transporter substrate-binding protein [Proteobacteria bacterium]|nr:ABC transporter substrate-binding protein [Pseudomonadota bacterium]
MSTDFFYKMSIQEANQLRLYVIQDALDKDLIFTAFQYLEDIEGNQLSIRKQWVQNIISKISNLDQIEKLLDIYTESNIKSALYMKKVNLWIDKGHYLQAADYLKLLVKSDELELDYYSELLDLQEFLETALQTEHLKIGVILPFSHKRFKTLATQVRDGLELALQDFDMNGRSVQLVFKDSTRPNLPKSGARKSRITRQHIKKVVQELVEQDNVIAILGPLAKNTSLAAGEAAERYRIPVISFSLTEKIGEKLPYLFRFQRSRGEEAKAMANYAMDYLRAKRFVLLYPANKTGYNSMKAFSEVVTARQGKIVGVSRVHRKQVDFQDIFMSITGGYRKISEIEIEELEKARERPTPIVDFDAIYTPFPPSTLNLMGSYLNLFSAEKIWILGDSRANVKENQKINYSKRLRFVDTFANSREKTLLKPFFEAHWRNYNYRKNYSPPTAYTFYGYEALELLIKLLNNPQNQTRESLKRALTDVRSFPVLTGNINKHENGELSKELKILRLRGRNTVSVF